MEPTSETNSPGEQLLAQALSDPEHFDGKKWNELLSFFFADFPAERLRELLTHANRDAIIGGLFIVEEIGGRAHPVLEEVLALLAHPDANLRVRAIYATRSMARDDKERVFVHVLRALQDPDVTCRVAAMWLIAEARDSTLAAASEALQADETNLREGIKGLLNEIPRHESEPLTGWRNPRLKAWCDSSDSVLRRFAAIGAARNPSFWHLLAWAVSSCNEDDINKFAVDYTKRKVDFLEVRRQLIAKAASKQAKD